VGVDAVGDWLELLGEVEGLEFRGGLCVDIRSSELGMCVLVKRKRVLRGTLACLSIAQTH
jgi:hypothetical protein